MCNPNRTPGNVEGVLQGAGWIWDTTKLPQGSFQPYIQWPIWLVVSYNRCCPYKSLSLSLFKITYNIYTYLYVIQQGVMIQIDLYFSEGLKATNKLWILGLFLIFAEPP
jgi:hypothetical protein